MSSTTTNRGRLIRPIPEQETDILLLRPYIGNEYFKPPDKLKQIVLSEYNGAASILYSDYERDQCVIRLVYYEKEISIHCLKVFRDLIVEQDIESVYINWSSNEKLKYIHDFLVNHLDCNIITSRINKNEPAFDRSLKFVRDYIREPLNGNNNITCSGTNYFYSDIRRFIIGHFADLNISENIDINNSILSGYGIFFLEQDLSKIHGAV